MKVKITFTEETLGTQCANPEVHEEFIAKKSADKEKIKEELEALHTDELMDKAVTVFAKDEDGTPIWWDYQIRGFIKEFFQMKTEFGEMKVKVGRKEYKVSKWTYKRIVDNFIFVKPRKIRMTLPEGGKIGYCTRPLRADPPGQLPRTALSTSESIPAGTTMEFEIISLQPELNGMLEELLNYGQYKGISQWRNSGKGTFTWELIE